jgi:hypothetical protein
VRDAVLIQVLHGAQQVVPKALEQCQIERPLALDPSSEGLLPSRLHGKPDKIVEVMEIERFHDFPELKILELIQDLEFVDEALVVFGVAGNFENSLVIAERDEINHGGRAATEPFLDQKTTGEPVALVCVQRVPFFFIIRAGEFVLDQVKPNQKIARARALIVGRLTGENWNCLRPGHSRRRMAPIMPARSVPSPLLAS